MAKKDLAEEVKQAFDDDENLGSYSLDAKANQGTVTITGIVDVLSEKRHADNVARNVPGVQKVENAISLSTDGQIDDGDVRFEVGEELGLYPEDELRQLSIQSNKGVVTLRGSLRNRELKEKAMEAAAKARGVVDIVSKIEVKE